MSPERQAAYRNYRDREGRALEDWATWCVLADIHGPDWRGWPPDLARPDSPAVAAERGRLAGEADFHAWVQWLASGQLAAAQQTARDADMDIGIIQDLAAGVHPGGADAWSDQDLFVPGVTVGTPPDEFNQRGQNWTLPPWHPERLAERDYRPLADLIAAAVPNAGALRVDHVMGLFRHWWVPRGMPPGRGTYLRYDHTAAVGVLAREAAKAGLLAIGEDLGGVEPWIREYLEAHGILGTSMLWFERRDDGTPRPPGEWRRGALATVGTPDLPPAAALLTGEHVTVRAMLGLLTRPEEDERADAEADMAAWRAALAREGLLSRSAEVTPEQFTVALYGFLARTPAMLIGVSLTEAVGERRPQNVPGTVDEFPNWRIPLADADGRAVLLEDLASHPGVRAVADAVCGAAPGAG